MPIPTSFSPRAVLSLCLVLTVSCGPKAASEQLAEPDTQRSANEAELVLENGTIITLDDDLPRAAAIAMRAGQIVAVGEAEEIAGWVGPSTQVVDLNGATAIPGFIEGHGHFLRMGQMELELDLRPMTSWQQIVAAVGTAAQSAQPGEVIFGRGWHQEKWTEQPAELVEGVPTHAALSSASPNNPVVLVHASGHATFVNAAALKQAGITGATTPPEGGEIVLDAAGQPTGMLRETAAALISGLRAEASPAVLQKRAQLAADACLRNGVTSFQDAGTPIEHLKVLDSMAAEGDLPVRLWMMVRDATPGWRQRLPEVRKVGAHDEFFSVRAIKHSVDGALGSHGAWLLEPYRDAPNKLGLNTTPLNEIEASARAALEYDYQLCVHAIGDRGNREILDLYAKMLGPTARTRDHRWRIEHAQHLHPDDIPRFAGLGVVASMQTVHCTSDAPWVEPRLGRDRAASGAYMWRKLLDFGVLVSNGTDVPVESIDPIANYHAAVTRQTAGGWQFYASQAMTRMEALRATTLSAAAAAFEEQRKGSLEEGKLADITVLSQNILEVDADEIPRTKIQMTIVGGEIRYEAGR